MFWSCCRRSYKGPHKAMLLLQVVVCTGSQSVRGITAVEAIVEHVTATGHRELMACGFQVKDLVSSRQEEGLCGTCAAEHHMQHNKHCNLSLHQQQPASVQLFTSLDRDLPCDPPATCT